MDDRSTIYVRIHINAEHMCLFSSKMGLYNCGVLIYEDVNINKWNQ